MYAFFYRKRLVVIQEHALNRQLESNAALKLKKKQSSVGYTCPTAAWKWEINSNLITAKETKSARACVVIQWCA